MLFLVPLVALQLFGSLSRPVVLAFLRLCIAAPSLCVAWAILKWGPQPLMAVFWVINGLTFGLAPYLRIKDRKVVYIGWLILGCLAMFGLQLAYPDGTGFLVVPGIAWIVTVCFVAKWTVTLTSPIDRAVLLLRDECRRISNWLNQPVSEKQWWRGNQRNKFIRELEGFFETTQNPDSRRVLREVCRHYEKAPLAWQVSYAIAISSGDYEEAISLIQQGHMAGHERELGSLPLAYAMAKSGDPSWPRTLARARVNGELAPGTYDDLRDPFLKWRTNPQFGRIESALMPSSEFLPPRIAV